MMVVVSSTWMGSPMMVLGVDHVADLFDGDAHQAPRIGCSAMGKRPSFYNSENAFMDSVGTCGLQLRVFATAGTKQP